MATNKDREKVRLTVALLKEMGDLAADTYKRMAQKERHKATNVKHIVLLETLTIYFRYKSMIQSLEQLFK